MRRATSKITIAATIAAALFAIGCGSGEDTDRTTAVGPEKTVSVALSWTPNTDYTGVYVADRLGYYREAGIKLKVIPYASTPPETLVSTGRADFGFSYQAGVAYARSAGQDVIAVFAPHQKDTYAIGVSSDRSDISSPKDLDGKTYAGFGTPDEGPELKSVIRAAGGKGEFRTVTLNTSAYEAVHSGKADFTIPVTTWEGVEAALTGKPMKYFRFEDYGFPEQYSCLIVANRGWLAANPDLAKRFIAATAKGYSYAASNPKRAAALMVAANPGAFKHPKVVTVSQRMLADGGYMKAPNGAVGVQSAERWQAYGDFLFRNGLLTDANGRKVTTEPDWSTYWTNDYLPGN